MNEDDNIMTRRIIGMMMMIEGAVMVMIRRKNDV